jgi:hypothetical protein
VNQVTSSPAVSSGSVRALSTEAWTPGSCAGAPRTLGGFLGVLELGADEAARHADALDRIRSGELQAVIVHDVYPGAVLEQVVERLEHHDPPFLQTWFPEKFRSWFYGRNVNLAHPQLAGYFEEAADFNAQLGELLPGPQGIIPPDRIPPRRSRPFEAAPGPSAGSSYMFTTLRAHLENGYIPPHFDNEQKLRPAYRHLATVVQLHMMSFVLAFTRPEGGGALEVFELHAAPENARMISDDSVTDKPDVSKLRSVGFRLPPGSMIVIDSGRFLHRVTPVQGSRKRWTACSFMALSRDGRAMYCWG